MKKLLSITLLFTLTACSSVKLSKRSSRTKKCLDHYIKQELSLDESIKACNYIIKQSGSKNRARTENCLDSFIEKELTLTDSIKACNHVLEKKDGTSSK